MTDPGAHLSGSIPLSSTSTDVGGTGIASVTFEYRTAGIGAWTPIATLPWNTKTGADAVADGLYDVHVVAYDNAGNVATSTPVSNLRVDNTAPAVTITNPLSSGSVADTVTLGESTTDADPSPAVVWEVAPHGTTNWTTVPASWNTKTGPDAVADGHYDIRATATDWATNVGTRHRHRRHRRQPCAERRDDRPDRLELRQRSLGGSVHRRRDGGRQRHGRPAGRVLELHHGHLRRRHRLDDRHRHDRLRRHLQRGLDAPGRRRLLDPRRRERLRRPHEHVDPQGHRRPHAARHDPADDAGRPDEPRAPGLHVLRERDRAGLRVQARRRRLDELHEPVLARRHAGRRPAHARRPRDRPRRQRRRVPGELDVARGSHRPDRDADRSGRSECRARDPRHRRARLDHGRPDDERLRLRRRQRDARRTSTRATASRGRRSRLRRPGIRRRSPTASTRCTC